jgi:hypothetical protein
MSTYKYVKKARKVRKQLLLDCLGGKCCRCGYNTCVDAIDFHHKDPAEKDFTIAKAWNNLPLVIEELKKCIPLCSNCHREFHGGVWVLDDIDLPTYDQSVINDYIDARSAEIYNKKCPKCCKDFTTKHKKQIACNAKCYLLMKRNNWPSKKLLKKLVWEKPSTKIAIDYGVSDRAVGKWCEGYEIDKPPRGYWSGK